MFKSGVTVKTMIDQIGAELKAYSPVPGELLLRAYNTVILKLYRENIKEQAWGNCEATKMEGIGYKINNLGELNLAPKFEDIVKIVVGEYTFSRVSVENRNAFDNVYYKYYDGSPMLVGSATKKINGGNIEVTYNESPHLVTEETKATEYIAVPDEFVGMIYSYVRSEGFKWLLETNNAAIWINDFNAQVVTFTEWITSLREPILG